MNLEEIKSTLLSALHEAGRILKNSLTERRIVQKKSELSLVTATDKAAEKRILDIIHQKFPGHSILTEESPPRHASGERWIIDPLDGTTNFAHTFPVSCVSIAFEKEGDVLLGGVYDPFRDELFFGEKGGGAYRNHEAVYVSKTEALENSLLATGFPYDRREKADEYLEMFKAFMVRCHGVRRTGAAAIDICYVACGRFDGFWELKLNPWDTAAATLIAKEAGARITDFRGGPFRLEGDETVVSNGLIHPEMMDVLTRFVRQAG